ncbi:Tat pathway signal sequence domain protein [Streptomyces sp. WI04-05B]|uniref:Tat pathway signal sequence domain protein n=1 Tax=Streptomyces TaxID=1883 RepID=UPI0029A97B52|nr:MULTISPECIES: Tat pathway signal sequence domain protein [unclassified Streptomyces]MDX2546827.1 Tat pathway signal sequence domain protein [Streptomyces sp. WI04-05B]MDX2589623.1 Tat pathway signal sequence domain protein [Streptomyces sp. WI04-05A]
MLKYAGTTGAATVGLGWLTTQSASAAIASPAAVPDSSGAFTKTICKPLDIVVFGDPASEATHGLTAAESDTVTGGLGQSARVLNPTQPATYWGGTLKFDVAVSPTDTTYVTVRLWGDDYDSSSQQAASGTNMWRLQLFCDGLQIGYQDEGAVDSLDILDTSPRSPGRFFFHTLPLPEKLTASKKKVTLEIRSMGRIWSYGQNAEQLYYKMTTPSRGIYRLYTHTEPYFVPPKGEAQGPAQVPTVRTSPGPEALEAVRKRVEKDQKYYLTTANPAGMDAFAFQSLAEGYLWSGSPAHQQDAALDRVLRAVDSRYMAWKNDDSVLTGSDQQWQGFGRVGLVLALLWEHLGDRLDQKVTGSPYELTNPTFEEGADTPMGWEVPGWGRTSDATWSRDTTVARSGSASLKVTATAANGFITVYSSPKTRVGKGTYTYGAWIRTEGVTGAGAHIDPLFFDASGNLVGSDHRQFAATGTHDWEQVSIDLETPVGATQVEFHLRLSGPGAAWFDDLAVVPPQSAGTTGQPVRRAAYVDMLKSSRDYWRQHFPHYTNQSQICAIGIYQANRGLRLLDPDLALPEEKARDYMYQSLGVKPYLGREDKDGNPTKPLGESYYQVTKAGLTRELGYVGSYGEVIDWLVMMYESVTRGHDGREAPELREQMVAMTKARSRFRVVDVDETGARVSRIETVIGWRNEVYPGEIAYASRTAWDSHPLMAAAVFKDPDIVGWTQEMVADGQFHKQLDLLINHTWTRVGLAGLRLVSRDFDAFQALPNRPGRIPTDWDKPDFVFTDEENGCIAIKNGKELLFASLYWRARQGVNNYARIHHLTPTDQRSATVRQRSAGTTDETFTAQDWILWDYAINDPGAGHIPPGGFPPPGGETLHQSQEGDVYRLAPVPADVPDPAMGVHFEGVETMLVGRAPFYLCEYGDYLIAMNTSTDQTFTLPARRDFGPARNLATGRNVGAGQRPKLGPRSTLVLFRGSRKAH